MMGQAPLVINLADTLDPLRSRFNSLLGSCRLIALVSPT